MRKAVVGKETVLVRVLLAILARGHILLEDMPGVGKTTMALAFSRALGLEYNRVQFTPDVLPSDIIGFSVFDKESGEMKYHQGAVLCNLFLADELNRATSRTQSALLEAMEEGQVTVDGRTHPVPQPFVVIATQNPTGASGTQLLPDSQMDRFMVRLSIGYPRPEDEREMLRRRSGAASPLAAVQQALGRGEPTGIELPEATGRRANPETKKELYDEGVYVNPVLPPAVHPLECLLRTSYMATHTEALLDEAADIIERVVKRHEQH